MPLEVNAEALREVLNFADSQSMNLLDSARNDPNFAKIFGEEGIEKIKLLDTSIWMLRNALEKHDAKLDRS